MKQCITLKILEFILYDTTISWRPFHSGMTPDSIYVRSKTEISESWIEPLEKWWDRDEQKRKENSP